MEDLTCKIYLHTDRRIDELAALVASAVAVQELSSGPGRASAATECGDIEIRANEDANPERAKEFPDGFLFFSSVIEFYAQTATKQLLADYITRILSRSWSERLPAVAACDFEDMLPKRGGYKDPALPWPHAHGAAVKLNDSHDGHGAQQVLS